MVAVAPVTAATRPVASDVERNGCGLPEVAGISIGRPKITPRICDVTGARLPQSLWHSEHSTEQDLCLPAA
jgi:hypothetical protein